MHLVSNQAFEPQVFKNMIQHIMLNYVQYIGTCITQIQDTELWYINIWFRALRSFVLPLLKMFHALDIWFLYWFEAFTRISFASW